MAKKKLPRNLHVILILFVCAAVMLGMLFTTNPTEKNADTSSSVNEEEMVADSSAIIEEIRKQNEAALRREEELRRKQEELDRAKRELEDREKEDSGDQSGFNINDKELERREAAAVSKVIALRHGANNLDLSALSSTEATTENKPDEASSYEDRYKAIRSALNRKVADTRTSNEKWMARNAATGPQDPIIPIFGPKGVTVHEGTSIRAVLLTRINTILPGEIVARVLNNIYDSQGGLKLAIPAGSKLIGRYNSSTARGQTRILAAFHRIILPNGSSIYLKAANGAGDQGTSGLPGKVDTHFWENVGSQLLLATVAWYADVNDDDSPSGTSLTGNNTDAYGQILTNAAENITTPYKDQQPTIYKKPGETFNVMVNQDILITADGV